MMRSSALYLHVPFCVRKCAYCDFASAATRPGDPLMARYVEALTHQMAQAASVGLGGAETAYIGGGTPTMLGADLLATLVRAAGPRTELTCEANPDSLTDAVISAIAEAGATRISIGVQSLEDTELAALGRIHTAEVARERVGAAVDSGLAVSVDLMCAIPHQTDASWEQTLRGALSLGVGHVSVYPLQLEEGTPLAEAYERAGEGYAEEDVQATRMEAAARVLECAGLARYEVASYARAGVRCQHNIGYWTGVPYLGLGTSAASMLGREGYAALRSVAPQLPEPYPDTVRVRLTVTSTTREIASAPDLSALHADLEFLDARQAWAEDLMLGMRLTDGVDERALAGHPDVESDLISRDLVRRARGRLVPTRRGWLCGNELYGALWDLAGGLVAETSC